MNACYHAVETPLSSCLVSENIKEWVGLLACMREMRNLYTVFVGKPEVKQPFGKSRHIWKDNRVDLKEIGW
jgi:hypothetical protein